MNIQKILDRKADEIASTSDNKKLFVAYGNEKVQPFIKGYVKTRKRKCHLTIRRKHQHCHVQLVDQFRTTKLCSSCYTECMTSKSPHRYQAYKNCKKVSNRDINAARNILAKAKYLLVNLKELENFSRRKYYYQLRLLILFSSVKGLLLRLDLRCHRISIQFLVPFVTHKV